MLDTSQVVWRGRAGSEEADSLQADELSSSGRILLLVNSLGNKEKISNQLKPEYECVHPDKEGTIPHNIDMIICDGVELIKWKTQIVDIKISFEPVFFPVLLLLPRIETKKKIKHYWDAVDEFLVTPIEKNEFHSRIAMLLRTRFLSLSQQSHLAYLVTHDRMTGLPNKALFVDRLTGAINDASLLNLKVEVIVVHLPLSKIMKSLGHYGLEKAATIFSSRLRAQLDENITVARVTTEEWGIFNRPGTPRAKTFEVCRTIHEACSNSFDVETERVHISPRIGVGVYPDDAADPLRTLDCAISALSEAIDANPVFYSREVQQLALRHIRTEAKIHEALLKEQFEIWYQPQLRLSDLSLVGVEALIRWRLPSGQLVSPGDFLPVAEASELIIPIDRWVIEKSCATMSKWRDARYGLERVAINISAVDLGKADFSDFICSVLKKYNLPPPSIELEITENTFLDSSDSCLTALKKLRDYGSSIAIDDFGTGYSSLNYLHKLPITTVKIDKSFVDNIHLDSTNAAITKTVTWLSKHFGLETIAEGIESFEQAKYLNDIGVDTAQGFLYAKPMPEHDLVNWLRGRQKEEF